MAPPGGALRRAAGAAVVLGLPWLRLGAASSSQEFLGRSSSRTEGEPAASGVKWVPLGGGNEVANMEGDELFQAAGSVEKCGEICSNYPGCKSYAYCGAMACFMKTEEVQPNAGSHFNQYCTTYYRATPSPVVPPPSPAAAAPTPAALPTAPPKNETVCHKMTSRLVMNQKQRFPSNPDAEAVGEVELTLCTDGNISAGLVVKGGTSQIIAATIDRCEGGDSPQTQTSVLCSGEPVINFCGDNTPGLFADGTSFPVACAAYDDKQVSSTRDMPGVVVTSSDRAAAQLVQDIFASPDKYYFNVHTMASYNHWYPQATTGMCRGALEPADTPNATDAGNATAVPAAAGPTDGVKCYSLFAQMTLNELQIYNGNPDSRASGYVGLKLCTNGTALATMLVYGGKTQIIATHIHLCKGGQTPQTRTGDLCEGAPVMNFCGDNSAGMISDGTNYTGPCAQYNDLGSSRTRDMEGALVKATNKATTFAQRVANIVQNPEMYYFNVHTIADYNHWYPDHKGACRGPLQLSRF